MMRTMTIEKALDWAYRRELPKAQTVLSNPGAMAGGWDAMNRFGEMMARVDLPMNGYGVFVDMMAEGDPHPDALAIARAVDRLDDGNLEVPEDWNPIEDLGDLGALGEAALRRGFDALLAKDAEGRAVLKTPPSRLVVKHALLGGEPDWQGERPVERVVTGPKGKPRWFRRVLIADELSGGWFEIEGDGWNEKRKRPYDDAYRRTFLDPDPAPVVTARGEYEVWRGALDVLVADLVRAGLTSLSVTASNAPLRPWEGDGRCAPRVLWARRSAPAEANLRAVRKRRARAS